MRLDFRSLKYTTSTASRMTMIVASATLPPYFSQRSFCDSGAGIAASFDLA